MNAADRPLLLILGPTASGKTDLSLKLNSRFPLRLISADSMQVYRGMDIGTAKPPRPERDLFALIDVADPGEGFSAGRFAALAAAEAARAWEEKKLPCIVGGTGLYVRALTFGLAEIPAVALDLRRAVAARPLKELAAELKARDPETAAATDLANPRRVQRAMEVLESTGRGLARWQSEAGSGALAARRLSLGLEVEAEILRGRIRQRTDRLLASGWLEEARGLEKRRGREALLSTGAIGYAEMLEVSAGRLDLAAAGALIAGRTVQYARRQRTWFRKEEGIEWMDPRDIDKISRRVERFLGGRLA